jgi:hypothetical protein
MVLNVAHIVEQNFCPRYIEPFKPTTPSGSFFRQFRNRCATFCATVLKIGQELVLRIDPVRQDSSLIHFVKGEGRGRFETDVRLGQIQIEKEQRVKRNIPILGPEGTIAPHVLGTRSYGILEHVDCRTELLP